MIASSVMMRRTPTRDHVVGKARLDVWCCKNDGEWSGATPFLGGGAQVLDEMIVLLLMVGSFRLANPCGNQATRDCICWKHRYHGPVIRAMSRNGFLFVLKYVRCQVSSAGLE